MLGSEELFLSKQEVKATCDSHWPAGSCQRAELNASELDQREPTRVCSAGIQGEERQQKASQSNFLSC